MKKYILLIVLSVGILANGSAQKSFYDFTVKDITGKEFSFAELKGKKVLVVNTASKCGFTPQFEDLEKLYKEYGGDSFTILGFPSNDFAKQDPGSNKEMPEHPGSLHRVTFPMMSKIKVKGNNKHPLYQWLTDEEKNGVEGSKVGWNFQKYMISESGELEGHLASKKVPYSKEILEWLSE